MIFAISPLKNILIRVEIKMDLEEVKIWNLIYNWFSQS